MGLGPGKKEKNSTLVLLSYAPGIPLAPSPAVGARSFRRQRRVTGTVGWREHPASSQALHRTQGDKGIAAVKHVATYLLLLQRQMLLPCASLTSRTDEYRKSSQHPSCTFPGSLLPLSFYWFSFEYLLFARLPRD